MYFRYLSVSSQLVIYLAMICTEPIPQWTSMTAPATVAGKYVMQLQRLDIMDVCSLNPTALCFWHNLAPSPEYTPKEQFTVSVMLNILTTLPPTHPLNSSPVSPTLTLLQSNKLVVDTLQDEPVGLNEQRVLFSPISVEMPLSKMQIPNYPSRSCTTLPVQVPMVKQLILNIFTVCTVHKVFTSSMCLVGAELSGEQGCGCSGRNRDRGGEEGWDYTGTKARQRGTGLGRDVVRTELRPTKAGKTAKKEYS